MDNKEILTQSLQDLEFGAFSNSLIQDNKLIFVYKDKTFRVRMPIQSEQASVDNKRNLTQLEYLKQEGCITRKQLTLKLKEVGVFDLEKIEE